MISNNSLEVCYTAALRRELIHLLHLDNFKIEEMLFLSIDQIQSCLLCLNEIRHYEYQLHTTLESGTSGDSSACYSMSEDIPRNSAPTLREAAKVLVDESCYILDPNYESIMFAIGSTARFLITNVSKTMSKEEFKAQFYDFQCSQYLKLNNLSFVFFNTEWSLKLSFEIQHKAAGEFLKCMFRDSRMARPLGKGIRVYWIKEYNFNRDSWFAVIFRSIPHFVKKENLEDLCKQENETLLFLGPKTTIKGVDCCLARFASLEDAENVCERLCDFPLFYEGERYYLKVSFHALYPLS